MQEMKVQSLDWEDPLEKGLATHSSILSCRMPWAEEPGGLQSIGWQNVKHASATNTFIFSHVLGSKLASDLHYGWRNGDKIGFSKNTPDPQILSTTHSCKES